MSRLGQISGVIVVIVAAIVQILTDPRITRPFITRSLLVLLAYSIYVGLGIAVALAFLPKGLDAAAGATLALLGWIGLGGLGLVRMAPRLREPPALLAKFGVADIICLAVMASGLLLVANA